jgi:hypothetical protein
MGIEAPVKRRRFVRRPRLSRTLTGFQVIFFIIEEQKKSWSNQSLWEFREQMHGGEAERFSTPGISRIS